MFPMRLKPRTAVSLKDWQENYILARRNKEEATRQAWEDTAKYFKTCQLNSTVYETLASPEMFKLSMHAYELPRQEEERQRQLARRRQKLRDMLQKENVQYVNELRQLSRTNERRLENEDGDAAPATIAISEGNKDDALHLPTVTQEIVESCRPRKHPIVVDPPADADVKTTVDQMKAAEAESCQLKAQQCELQKFLQELKHREEQRSTLARHLSKDDPWRWKLVRPYKVQLQMQGRRVTQSLSFDVKLLDVLVGFAKRSSVMGGDDLIADLRQIREVEDTNRSNLMAQLRKEQGEVEFAEGLFQEEAKRVWLSKESEWKEEAESRDGLFHRALGTVRSCLQSSVAACLEKMQRNVEKREDLLRRLDVTTPQ